MRKRLQTLFPRATIEDWLNALTALVFLGALIYFIATAQLERVPLGPDQQFCQCQSNVALTMESTPTGPSLCVARVEPSLVQQSAGVFFDFYFNKAGGTREEMFNATTFGPCTMADIKKFSFGTSEQTIVFPDSTMQFSCNKFESPTTFQYFVNVTTPSSLEFGSRPGVSIKQVYYFHSETFEFATIMFDYVFGLQRGPGEDFQAGECVLFLDGRDWSSLCTCPLNVISHAVAIATITILILFPVRFYRLCRPVEHKSATDLV